MSENEKDIFDNVQRDVNFQGNMGNDKISDDVVRRKKTGKKKKTGIIVLIIIILVLILIAGLVYYKMVSSKNVFKVLVDNTFNYLEENIIDSKSTSGDFSLKVNGSSSDSSSDSMFDIINKIEFNGTYGIDYENKIINMDIKTSYDSKKLLNVSMYAEDEMGYIFLENLYDKYIRVPLDDYDSIFSSMDKKDDYKIILSSVHEALNNSLKDEYFVKDKDTMDGEKVDKITLKLDKTNYMAIKRDIINSLVNDNEFLNSMAVVSDKSVDEIKNSLNDSLDDDDDFEGVDISIYTKGLDMNFVRCEISDDNNKITVSRDDDKYNFEYIEDELVTYTGSVKIGLDNGNYNYVISLNDRENNSSIELTLNNSLKYNVEISKKDVSNSVNYEDMTDKEMQDIYFKLLENESLMEIIEKISGMSSSDQSNNSYGIIG